MLNSCLKISPKVAQKLLKIAKVASKVFIVARVLVLFGLHMFQLQPGLISDVVLHHILHCQKKAPCRPPFFS